MGVRRVVTGHEESGKSVFASDGTVEPHRPLLLPGAEFYQLWGGAEVTLNPGDTVVQNGTMHRWKNPGDKPARMAVFMCGANHAMIAPA
jgi:hypothetical protein